MSAEYRSAEVSKLSDTARNAFQDLKTLGYDIEALGRRNMNDYQILELRDKAFKFRGMQVPAAAAATVEGKGVADFVKLFELGVGLSSKSPPEEARMLAKHILYLAEKQLAEY